MTCIFLILVPSFPPSPCLFSSQFNSSGKWALAMYCPREYTHMQQATYTNMHRTVTHPATTRAAAHRGRSMPTQQNRTIWIQCHQFFYNCLSLLSINHLYHCNLLTHQRTQSSLYHSPHSLHSALLSWLASVFLFLAGGGKVLHYILVDTDV